MSIGQFSHLALHFVTVLKSSCFENSNLLLFHHLVRKNIYFTFFIFLIPCSGEDAASGELPEERWNPAQRVRTILLSVISLLNEPNTSSPADVDASVAYRKWKEGSDDTFKTRVLASVAESKKVAEAEGVTIPTTTEVMT